jgi:hypothetical protein
MNKAIRLVLIFFVITVFFLGCGSPSVGSEFAPDDPSDNRPVDSPDFPDSILEISSEDNANKSINPFIISSDGKINNNYLQEEIEPILNNFIEEPSEYAFVDDEFENAIENESFILTSSDFCANNDLDVGELAVTVRTYDSIDTTHDWISQVPAESGVGFYLTENPYYIGHEIMYLEAGANNSERCRGSHLALMIARRDTVVMIITGVYSSEFQEIDQILQSIAKSVDNLIVGDYRPPTELPEETDQDQNGDPEDLSCPQGVQEKINSQELSIFIPGAVLHGCSFAGMSLSQIDLSGADLRYTNFSGTDLRNANLSIADLRWADFENANMSGAILIGADARWVNFDTSEHRMTGTDFQYTLLDGAYIPYSNIWNAIFTEDTLKNIQTFLDLMQGPEGPIVWYGEDTLAAGGSVMGFLKYDLLTGEQFDIDIGSSFAYAVPTVYSSHHSSNSFLFNSIGDIFIENTQTKERTIIDPSILSMTDSIRDMVMSPDGNLIAIYHYGATRNTISMLNIEGGNIFSTFEKHQDTVNGYSWNPDGTKIASGGSSNLLRIWDINSEEEILVIRTSSVIEDVEWNPIDNRIAVIDGGAFKIIEAETGEVGYDYVNSPVYDVAWSPDGNHIALLSRADSSLSILDGSTYTEILNFQNPNPNFDNTVLVWNGTGSRVAVVSTTDRTLVYVFPIGFLLGEE